MVLLLGGSGYIGQAYQRFLKARKISFQVVDRAKIDYLHRYGRKPSKLGR